MSNIVQWMTMDHQFPKKFISENVHLGFSDPMDDFL
jgi:hypothetical protein